MLQGQGVRLHRGTICHLKAAGKDYDGAACTVVDYKEEKKKWLVRLEGEEWAGRQLLASEASMALAYCLLPVSLSKLRKFKGVTEEGVQGSCGRGLLAAQSVGAGNPIFEEAPFMVVYKAHDDPFVHHAHRWRAYSALELAARRDGDVSTRAAVNAFDDLDYPLDRPSAATLHEVAEAIADSTAAAESGGGIGQRVVQRTALVQQVAGVLNKFRANEFGFANGPEVETLTPAAAAYRASAVYAFISRVNHSCEPSCGMVSKEGFHAARSIGFKLAQVIAIECH